MKCSREEKKKSLAVDVDVDHDQNDIVLRETEKDWK